MHYYLTVYIVWVIHIEFSIVYIRIVFCYMTGKCEMPQGLTSTCVLACILGMSCVA